MFFLSHFPEQSVLSRDGSHSPSYLPRIPSNTVLISGPPGGCSDSNLVLLLCVFASNVHCSQSWCIFFCGQSQWPFVYSIDTESA